MSATTWPDPAVELVWAWQPLSVETQRPVDVEVPDAGGPRAGPAPPRAFGPFEPVAELRTVPVHELEEPQFRVADTLVQLDAPVTVGAPEFALEPGAVGVAGCCWPGC
jgi:hypothetical protein